LIYNQLSQYYNLFKYSWFKSGCTNERPEEFKSSVKFSFEETSTIRDIVSIILLQLDILGVKKKIIRFKAFFIYIELLYRIL